MKTIYTTSAVASGNGRDGRIASLDGLLAADVRMPPELGGQGGATNPEQLFAAGYAACFHSALKLVAGADATDTSDSEVVADVSLGALDSGAFGLAVSLEVSLPALEHADARALIERAHQVCPYSNAVRGNVEVSLSVA
jgi:lipoyl-dependent peroxiredoxin